MKGSILLISQNFYPELGSAANRMKKMFEQLDKVGLHPFIVTTEPSYPNKELFKSKQYYNDPYLNKLENHRIHRIKMRFNKQHPNLVYRLLYYIELMIKLRFYLKQTNHFKNIIVTSPNIFLAWATLFFKNNKKAKYFLEIRDLWPDSFLELTKNKFKLLSPWLKWLEKHMYKQADEIIINNPFFGLHINKLLKEDKNFIYLPNAFSKEESISAEKLDEFSVIYTGNIGYAQNVEQLIEIARMLNEKEVHFTAIVYGVHADLFRQVVRNEQLKYVHLIPPMDRHHCLSYIAKHHVSLSILKTTHTFMNVMPGKVVDSICCNTPIVSNLGGITGDLINDNKVGYSKENATTEEIVQFILKLKNNPNDLQELIDNAQVMRDKNFIWEENIKKLTKVLRGNS
ncbi:glycosyltransferase family 4 protein [Staphylococcus sp. 11261D007BR]